MTAAPVLVLVVTLGGCASVGTPLPRPVSRGGYRFMALGSAAEQNEADETFVALTFSGGGTRAAAFAYGVMEALRATQLANGRPLLDEVDVQPEGSAITLGDVGVYGGKRLDLVGRAQPGVTLAGHELRHVFQGGSRETGAGVARIVDSVDRVDGAGLG